MLEIPQELKDMKVRITIIWKEQDKAIQLGKELVEDGFEFKGKGLYKKGHFEFKTGYDDTLKQEFFREVRFDPIKKETCKHKRKKRVKPAKKNKKK